MVTPQQRLFQACRDGDEETVRSLLQEEQVDIRAKDEHGDNCVDIAIHNVHLAITGLLYAALANERNRHDEATPLLIEAVKRNQVDDVESLLALPGCDVNAANEKRYTALHYATLFAFTEIARLLVDTNASVHTKTHNGVTPLHFASMADSLEMVSLLLARNANVHATDSVGDTPLHNASEFGRPEIARALLEAGANLHAQNDDDMEPIHCCIVSKESTWRHGHVQVLQLLMASGAEWDAKCDVVLTHIHAFKEAPAMRLCALLWMDEHTRGLPLTQIPHEVVQQGAQSTQVYIDQLKQSIDVVLRCKICIVGPSNAGKTSLIKSLTSSKPTLEHKDDRTIGVDLFKWGFRITGDGRVEQHEITFWDFAGQDAYHVAHSLFFSQRTLFLVCVDLEAFSLAYLQASLVADSKAQVRRLMNEIVERAVLRWVRIIIARQPDATFKFVATKDDLLVENARYSSELKTELEAMLGQVSGLVEEIKTQLSQQQMAQDRIQFIDTQTFGNYLTRLTSRQLSQTKPPLLFVSCVDREKVNQAHNVIEREIVTSNLGFAMPDSYSRVLQHIQDMWKDIVGSQDPSDRVARVFAPIVSLVKSLSTLTLDPATLRSILRTLHDLGDVLWYQELDVGMLKETAILDPLLLVDFVRQIINHNEKGLTISHDELKGKPYWLDLDGIHAANTTDLLLSIKKILQEFQLVHPTNGEMKWDSDLIVPAYWKVKTPASWKFAGEQVRLRRYDPQPAERVRVHWEYQFLSGLPDTLFDHLVVVSYSPFSGFEAGPDWILYADTHVCGCRIMVSRDLKTLHRTLRLEAVVAESAAEKQVCALWQRFERLLSALEQVLKRYPGLVVTSCATDAQKKTHNLKSLFDFDDAMQGSEWMPPRATCEKVRELMIPTMRSQKRKSQSRDDVDPESGGEARALKIQKIRSASDLSV